MCASTKPLPFPNCHTWKPIFSSQGCCGTRKYRTNDVKFEVPKMWYWKMQKCRVGKCRTGKCGNENAATGKCRTCNTNNEFHIYGMHM